jgi:hypothetical protein
LAGSLVPAAPGEAKPKRFEYQQILMGVPVKILVYSADESLANAAVHAARRDRAGRFLSATTWLSSWPMPSNCRAARRGLSM